jgi:hypothetical protein
MRDDKVRMAKAEAQEYLRQQLRERSAPDHELEWPFPLTRDDRLFVRAVANGDWSNWNPKA